MAENKVLVLGARGMLGTDLCVLLAEEGLAFRALDLPEFDITDCEQLEAAVSGAGVVINCAAYTNVDGAESEPELSSAVNAEAVGRLGQLAAEQSAWVLHVSTDFVFDGRKEGAYLETDEPNPLGVYGASKLAGERALFESGCAGCVLRVQWTYGRAGANFVTKLIAAARERDEISVVEDQIGSPTATVVVGGAIRRLMDLRPEGLFHFSASGHTSRYDMARRVFKRLGLDTQVKPCQTADYPSPAQRPLNSRFDCRKIEELLGSPADLWHDPLDRFLEEL